MNYHPTKTQAGFNDSCIFTEGGGKAKADSKRLQRHLTY